MLALGASAALLTAGPAFAGEITGNGTPKTVKGKSLCAFSGLNDNPGGVTDPITGEYVDLPGQTQTYAQEKAYYGFPAKSFNPGDICRGNIVFPPPPA